MTLNNNCEKTPNKIMILIKETLSMFKNKAKNILNVIYTLIFNIAEEVEIYQVIGGVGCFFLMIGSFSNLLSIKCYDLTENIDYMTSNGAIILLLAICALILIVFNNHKYCIVPGFFALAQNISIRLGVNEIIEYINFGVGYYVVWIGGLMIVISTFLINCGYAKDSGLRKNKPIYLKDIVWICIIMVGAIIFANLSAQTSVNSNYVKRMEEIDTNIDSTYL